MCGIVGYVGTRQATPLLLEGLRKLEYRGYDSAGLAVLRPVVGGVSLETQVVRARGKLANLEALVTSSPPQGTVGIGHTRWATHGRPSEENAHPHRVGAVSVVHNGIIENHLALRARLSASGRRFSSETDTEIVAHLIDLELSRPGVGLAEATRRALAVVEGAYAICVVSEREPDRIVVAKSGSPMVLGVGQGESFVASDVPAILGETRDMIFLEDGDLAELTAASIRLFALDGGAVERAPKTISWSPMQAEKAGYKHFMLKEIHEQPRAVTDTLRGRVSLGDADVLLDGVDLTTWVGGVRHDWLTAGPNGAPERGNLRRIYIVACGTSYHAALYGKWAIEQLSRLPVEVDLASEFRYRDPLIGAGDLFVAISQSGETADTLAAAKEARARGARVLAIANVVDSSIARAATDALYTHAGPEIGVASTKAFTTQLIALLLVALHLGRRTGGLTAERAGQLLGELVGLPHKLHEVLDAAAHLQILARRYMAARDVLFLGRGPCYPIALEGALKLKELSYVHAEGYASGEMKHGPIALVDAQLPVIGLAPKGPHYEKILSNLAEVRARDAKVIAVATRGDGEIGNVADEVVLIPEVDPLLQPMLTVVPLQLFAYYVADLKGTDVDQPRNLAKSVTVE
jgi:glucosamine--fructose-6-phosphate aminotransferase (isomerizing)